MIISLRKHFAPICIVLSGILAILSSTFAKPSLSGFSLPAPFANFPSLTTITQEFVERKHAEQMKSYSGIRKQNDSLIMIYHHDQLVAVVELGPEKLLIGCELIEIYNDKEGGKLLKRLSKINKPLAITFKEMLNLMNQCDIVERQSAHKIQTRSNDDEVDEDDNTTPFINRQFPNSPLSLFSGIMPGTKWCGTGDIATTFNDLGTERQMDACCRAHDLCPTKIRAYQTRYNITNNSIYSKSHCVCDDMLYECLKKLSSISAAQVMGSIYFNIIQVPCIQNTAHGVQYRKARAGF